MSYRVPRKCLVPNCGHPQRARGLCLPCYKAALRLILEKKTTWQKLITAGKCKDRQQWGRKASEARQWFLQ